MQVQEELKKFLFENGVADVGFTCVSDGPFGERSYALSIVVKLSDAVIDEITDSLIFSPLQNRERLYRPHAFAMRIHP